MSTDQALAMFAISTLLSLSLPVFKSKVIFTAASTSTTATYTEGYLSMLDRLFTVRKKFENIKQPSRHSGTTETEHLLKLRKSFFNKVFDSSFSTSNKRTACKIVHVAGTKGKGSTVEYISSGLIADNNKVGIFSSPHLHTARERIKLNRDLISPSDMIASGTKALDLLQGFDWVVIFDQLLTTSLVFFGTKDVDYIVLEAGIGGRFDSTNFIDNPVACVITSISLDHQAILGETVEEIAWQKAGIIKHNSQVFTPSTQQPGVLAVFRKQCHEVGATLHEVPVELSALTKKGFEEFQYDIQTENACLSMAVLEHLSVPPHGMKQFYWPCRVESFEHNGSTIVLDGCHNTYSVETFLKGLKQRYPTRKIWMLFGASAEKSVECMLGRAALLADNILLVQSGHFRAMSEGTGVGLFPVDHRHKLLLGSDGNPEGAELRAFCKGKSTVGDRLQWAMDKIRRCDDSSSSSIISDESNESPVIAVCGSLFVAAEAREALFRMCPDLFSESDWVRQSDPPIDPKGIPL